MYQDVRLTLTLLASSPDLKEEDRSIVALFIKLAGEDACGITMLELLAASQYEGSMPHFRHPLADVLAEEFVGGIAIVPTSRERDGTPFAGEDVWFDGDTYHAKRNAIEIIWTPARHVKQHLLEQEERRRELHAELDAA